jgi:predicted nucleic acid-binding protein
MKPSVYVETSVVSYLTARPSRDLVMAGHQQATLDWWATAKTRFELVTSQLVITEASAGNSTFAAARLSVLRSLDVLQVNEDAESIAAKLIELKAIPTNAAIDALHIGIAAANGIDYLVTWNFRHLANAMLRSKINAECVAMGFHPVAICTCEELKET